MGYMLFTHQISMDIWVYLHYWAFMTNPRDVCAQMDPGLPQFVLWFLDFMTVQK